MSVQNITSRSGVNHVVETIGDGAPLVLIHSLGTNMSIWDDVISHLPQGLKILRYDLRGHGQSDVPEPPYSMGAYVSDAEDILETCGIRDAVVVGLSVGGKIAQGLAVKRLDMIRAVVLSNTAARTGTPAQWKSRIEDVEKHGLSSLADATMERWFSKDFRKNPEKVAYWRSQFLKTKAKGYIGCCNAVAGADFYSSTSGLRLPALGIAASEDSATPPDLVRETTDLIPGSKFHLLRRAGHLPCVEKPAEYADIVTQFLRDVGHI